MGLGQRKVSEHEAEIIAHVPAHTLDHRMRAAAKRAFEVPVLDESNRRVAGTEGVVALGDGNQELG